LDLQRQLNETGYSIPIIMISTHDDRLRAKALEHGAVAFLVKPFHVRLRGLQPGARVGDSSLI
jgi:FixJ family two-component response regulator